MNTFRLRLPQMFAKIIAAQGDDTISVCESKTAAVANVTNVAFSSCRGVSSYSADFWFVMFNNKRV